MPDDRDIPGHSAVPSSFLAAPAVERLTLDGDLKPPPPAVGTSGEALPPERRYELGDILGVGGIGRVVRAHDRQLDRTVAVKLLTHDDPAVRRLFLAEGRSQARVRHDHVLDVYDTGLLDGVPYLAMRLVDGPTLGEIGPTLPLEARVRLLIQVADGLHAAHREGLLHRDVKPSNVLVEGTADGDLRAWVTDFGLATDLAAGDPTVAGAVAGTPRYIAPERLAGGDEPIDRRADVYSLGVVAYELVTGRLPHDGADTLHVLRRVLAEPPVSPRHVRPDLPPELEAIVLRCLAREPSARYGSARAVAADLQRYLDGEVAEAYAAGLAYRATRFVLRNRALAAVATLALATLLVASAAVAVFAWRAELRRGQAEELLRFVLVDLRDDLESLGRLEVLERVDEAALAYFAAVPPGTRSETELVHRSAMLHRIGQMRLDRGDFAGAVEPLTEALDLTRRLQRLAPDDPERLYALGQSLFWVGYVHWEDGRPALARPHFRAYLDHSLDLVALEPDNLDYRRELGYAQSNLGSLLLAEGELDGALGRFRDALAIEDELVKRAEAPAEAQAELAASHVTVGKTLQQLGRLAEAERHLRRNVSLCRDLERADPVDVPARERLGAAHGHLGTHLLLVGRWDEAAAEFDQMERTFAALAAHDPERTDWRYQWAWSQLWLGRVARVRGDNGAARSHGENQGRLMAALVATDPAHPSWRRARAVGLLFLADLDGDAAALAEALAILEPLARERPEDRHVGRWLGRAALAADDAERAVRILEPLARDSRDVRFLAPWRDALACSGHLEMAHEVSRRLAEQGYDEAGEPSPPCAASAASAAMSSVRSASRGPV